MRHERFPGLPNGSNWTEDRVDLLRKLWADGWTASHIAGRMGGVTRNAVIGKVHRLKLPPRSITTSRAVTPKCKAALSPRPPKRPARKSKPRSAIYLRYASFPSEIAEDVMPALARLFHRKPRVSHPWAFETSRGRHLRRKRRQERLQEWADNLRATAEPKPLGLDVLDLRPGVCHWPLGDPKQQDFGGFCGHPAHGSFCTHHHYRAYRPG